MWAGKELCRHAIGHGLRGADAVYAFNGAALELLTFMRNTGKRAVVEQTIAPAEVEDRIVNSECQAFPQWERGLHRITKREELAARERAEWQAAHTIVCGSDFVKDGVMEVGGPVEKCAVVPYGIDLSAFLCSRKSRISSSLNVLTIGTVGLRKGSQYVSEVASRMSNRVSFRAVGRVLLSPSALKKLRQHVEVGISS